MKNFKDVNDALDRMNDKLDLLLELVKAQKAEDWKRVDEVCKKTRRLEKRTCSCGLTFSSKRFILIL